jgi:hypothetical protein
MQFTPRSKAFRIGVQRRASSSKAVSTGLAGRCGQTNGHAKPPEKVAWAERPKLRDALAASSICSTAHF